jgi:hypothetical protein
MWSYGVMQKLFVNGKRDVARHGDVELTFSV